MKLKLVQLPYLTIVVFIWLYNFLKGKDYFQKYQYYYSIYDKIGGLEESSPIEVTDIKSE